MLFSNNIDLIVHSQQKRHDAVCNLCVALSTYNIRNRKSKYVAFTFPVLIEAKLSGKLMHIKYSLFHGENKGRADNGFHSDGGSVKMWAAI